MNDFEHDLLISYAHLDDQALVEGEPGWISRLHRLLEIRVGQLLGDRPKIWRDPKLQGNDYFSAYRTSYGGIVAQGEICVPADDDEDDDEGGEAIVPFPCPSPDPPPDAPYRVVRQFQNLVDMEVLGVELRGETRLGRVPLFGNLTFTDPSASAPGEVGGRVRLRIGDIAGLTANLGTRLAVGRRAELDLRGRYVGARRTGEGTTVTQNLRRRIDAYAVADAAFGYKGLPGGASVQLIVTNLFDRTYQDPGIQMADRYNLAAAIPQAGRRVYLRLTWGLAHRRPMGAAPGLRSPQ